MLISIKSINHRLISFGLRHSFRSVHSCLVHSSSNNQHGIDFKDPISRTRNLGIIAHIDAGKTTTTERMLFYSGMINTMGEVDKGDTVTDYMEQERERGITITSASVRFDWRKHLINLIDTPGHVDFTFEVERCLSVLDSAVVILDASAGVEAQTITVWHQSEKYRIPKLIYINKMDKPRADFEACVQSVRDLTTTRPLLIQLPLFNGENKFHGVIDLITMEKIVWNLADDANGGVVTSQQLTNQDGQLYKKALHMREELIGHLSDHDSALGESILEFDDMSKIPSSIIVNALRRCTIRNQVIPITLGSSYKNLGVQLLLDTIVKLLPSPLEKNNELLLQLKDSQQLCAFAFKVLFHRTLGNLTFVRIYSGRLNSGARVHNSTRKVSEKVIKIFVPFADNFKEVAFAEPGSIVAISGLTQTYTGDSLMQSRELSDKLAKEILNDCGKQLSVAENLVLNGLKPPAPVFFCSVEAPSVSKQKDLEFALQRLQREDPSFTVKVNEETDQIVLNGMGELHLEIIKDRIHKEYKIEPFFGNLQISYRESIDSSAEELVVEEKNIKGMRNYVCLRLRLLPCEASDFRLPHKVKVIPSTENGLQNLRIEKLHSIEEGVRAALNHGSILGFPVINCLVELLEFDSSFTTMNSIISSTAQRCIMQALQKASPFLLEPIMRLEIITPESLYGLILKDLSARRSTIGESMYKNRQRVLTCYTPLAEITGYSSDLRRLSSGKANLFMQLHDYVRMNVHDQEQVFRQVNGYI